MDRLLPLNKLGLNTVYFENIYQKIESTMLDVYDEKYLPLIFGISSIVVASTVYIYYNHKYNYWKRKGVPSPPVTPFFGHTLTMTGPPCMVHDEWQKKYGPVVGIYYGTKPVLVVSDADMLNEVLVRAFSTFSWRPVSSGLEISNQSLTGRNGAEWKHDRTITATAFTSGKIKQLLPQMMEFYKYLDREMERFADEGREVPDIKPVYSKFTMMFISKVAFGVDIDPFNSPDHKLIEMLSRWIDYTPFRAFMRYFLPNWAKKLFRYSAQDPEAAEYLASTIREVMKKRRMNPNAHNEYRDLLQFMIDARLDESQITADGPKNTRFSDMKIIANSILFFVAGYDTSSVVLTWTSYTLAMNPDVQERLYQEIKETKEEKGELDYDTLFKMEYLEAVIKETLRMFPPAVRMERMALGDYTFANGLSVEKGCGIIIPNHAVGRNPENWPDPNSFRPERFFPENKNSIKPCSFLPFSEGPRICVGYRLGMLEVRKTICELLLKYKFVRTARTPENPVMNHYTIICDVDAVPLKIVRR